MKIYLLFLLLITLSKPTIGQETKDLQLVKNVVLAFQNDFNNGEFKKVETYTTDDWEHINPGGGITKGRKAVLEEVRAVHQTFLKGVTMVIESMEIRFLTPNVAIAKVTHKITSYELPQGVKHENERQMKTYIIIKKGKKWWLTLDQNTVIAIH
jgi:uncharacterized protein (TIGR02246 family)